MVDKVIVSPEEVRGLGNVVIPKSVDDFGTFHVSLSLSDNVYTMVYDGTMVTLTITTVYVKSGDSLTVRATVTDSNGDPVSGASVELFKEVIE